MPLCLHVRQGVIGDAENDEARALIPIGTFTFRRRLLLSIVKVGHGQTIISHIPMVAQVKTSAAESSLSQAKPASAREHARSCATPGQRRAAARPSAANSSVVVAVRGGE